MTDVTTMACTRIGALAASILFFSGAFAQEATVSYKSLSPEVALELARAGLTDCRDRGYQVAVAVVDRFGVTQVLLRDRFAGPHTTATASGKAWTAVTFRTNTTELNAMSQPGMMQAGIRNLPGVVILGDADDACAKAALTAIRDKLDFP
jgi:uncharacterized protein GlcG (DUF336 family)